MAFRFKNLKVLIADDDRSIREIMKAVLETLEFQQVDVATSGKDAFAKFKSGNHDVIITDWQMSPVNGIDLVKKIRSCEDADCNKMVPIILATGYTNMKMIDEARNAGVSEFLIKPYAADDLAKRIAYVLNKPREFIEIQDYTGPDRRRVRKPDYQGPKRRKEDRNV